MSERAAKTITKKNRMRQLSPEIPSPVKIMKTCVKDNDEDVENRAPIDDTKTVPMSLITDSDRNINDSHQMAIILANGQPLLTNFEEKYLLDFILKSSNKDIDILLKEKVEFILQMNYGSQASLFTLNTQWIYDFLLKHFQTLVNYSNSSELFEKFLNKTFNKNNSTIAFKHWQLKTLFDEHSKRKQSTAVQKRRMTVRHIDLK